MPKLTVSEASRQFSIPRSTIYKKMEDGSLSFEIIGKRRVLDPSELERCFPSDRPSIKTKPTMETSQEQHKTSKTDRDTQTELECLKVL